MSGRPHPIRVAALGTAAVVGLLVILLATRTPGSTEISSPLVGRPAPPLEGPTLSGKDFDLRDYRGSWVLVNFFATWCPPCQQEHPELVKFSAAHAGKGDAFVVSVAFNDEASAIRAFFADRGGSWPVLAEDTGHVALDYGVVKLPESYLVAPDGTVVAKVAGGVVADQVDRLIARYS